MKQQSFFEPNRNQISLYQRTNKQLSPSNNLNRTTGNHRKIFNPQPHSLSKRVSLNPSPIGPTNYAIQNNSSVAQNLSIVATKQQKQMKQEIQSNLTKKNRNQIEQQAQKYKKLHNNDLNRKHMAFMREQIEISCKFYTEKMNKQILAQSKQIIQLKNQLAKNQNQLKAKQRKIAQISLKPFQNISRISSQISNTENRSISRTKTAKEGCIRLNQRQKHEASPIKNLSSTPNKKKISITGKDKKQQNKTHTQIYATGGGLKSQQNIYDSPSVKRTSFEIIQQLNSKIVYLESQLCKINHFEKQKLSSHQNIQKKIQSIEKGTIKILGFQMRACEKKLHNFFEAHNSRILRIQGNLQKITGKFSTFTPIFNGSSGKKNSIFDQNDSQLLIKDLVGLEELLIPIKSQIGDLKQKTKEFLQKQFKYDNYQLNQLLIQLNKVKRQVSQLEEQQNILRKKLAASLKQNNLMNQKLRQMSIREDREYDEFLQNKEDFSIFKLCRTQSLQLAAMESMNLYRISSNQIRKTKRPVEAAILKYQRRDITTEKEKFVSTQQIKEKDQSFCTQNILTPQIKRKTIERQINYQQLVSKQNASKITQQTKYGSGNRSGRQNCFENLIKDEAATTAINRNQREQYEAQSVQSREQNFMNQESSQDQFYYDNQDQENNQYEGQQQDHQQRLIEVIQGMSVALPIQVEVDQTGYLKSVKSGMYIVDDNNDGFELSDGQIHSLIQKGVIFI